MAKMIVTDLVRRTSTKNTFHIVVTKAAGGDPVELSTPIVKVTEPLEYRKVGARTVPVEQYAFEVAGKKVDRFADATAIVLKRHQVQIAEGVKIPTYAQKAVAINAA